MKSKSKIWLVVVSLLYLLFFNCSMDLGIDPVKPPPQPETTVFPHVEYKMLPPAGKLPYPHHDPEFTELQYLELNRTLWIINNFAQYQGSGTKESLYFHDGLDIVLENGTKIFAVDSGYVRYIFDGGPSYTTVVIEDANTSDYAWMYTHVYYLNVKVGDFVSQGTHIADVNFDGLGHIHFGRAFLAEDGAWDNMYDWHYVQPDDYFIYTDNQAPVIEQPFYYFVNNSDEQFLRANPTLISGDVDIVIGMRERGEYAHSKDSQFGDRLCVSRIEYEISGDSIETIHKKSFDFGKIILKTRPEVGFQDYERVSTVFKYYETIHPDGPPNWDKVISYYVITNCDGSGEFGQIDPVAKNFCWRTNETNPSGERRFPNGTYTIKVTAYDFKGNFATAWEKVVVEN